MNVAALLGRVSASFWFLPMVLTVSAAALFLLTHQLDRAAFRDLSAVPLLFSGGPSAARDLLSSIAGSLITVIGTAFSLTIVTFTLTSGQYTPRMLKTLSSDRGLRVVLGAYIATFVYSLLALRTVRSGESSGEEFVPIVSVTTAFGFALVCVGLLIYFIYHVINLIQPSTLFERLHAEMLKPLRDLEDLGSAPETAGQTPDLDRLTSGEPATIRADRSGYVQTLDVRKLVEAVCSGGGTRVVELPHVVGDFVSRGLDVVRVWPAGEGGLSERAESQAREAVVFGKERSNAEDFTFGLRQLTDIALRGLSPSTNDPTTAMQALDRIEAALVLLGGKRLPPRFERRRVDSGGEVFVLAANPTFEDVVKLCFDQSRRAALSTGQVVFLERWLEVVENAASANGGPERRRVLWSRALDLALSAPGQLPDERDALALTRRVCASARRFAELEPGLTGEIEKDLDRVADLWKGSARHEEVREAVRMALREAGGRP